MRMRDVADTPLRKGASFFWRALAPGIARVRIQARDRKNGYGGTVIELALPQRP